MEGESFFTHHGSSCVMIIQSLLFLEAVSVEGMVMCCLLTLIKDCKYYVIFVGSDNYPNCILPRSCFFFFSIFTKVESHFYSVLY